MDNIALRSIGISFVMGLVLLLLLNTFIAASQMLPNGVAAGDTTQTSAVLWARGTITGDVLFEYSTSASFSDNVLTATTAVTNLLRPVKVEIAGLSPATTYFYSVTDAAGVFAEGHFRTAATVGTHAGLRFGVSGDWKGELAPYPSIANADERNLDFFIEHGDTIVAGSATTLEDFRLRHNEVYSTHLGLNTWADLRASTSILATIDDNEVRNDFAGGADASTDSRFVETSGFINETQLYGIGLRAFQEYNPLRNQYYGAIGDPRMANKRKLYRFNTYGSDAALFILDTRSFRDEQLPQPTTQLEVITFLMNSLSDASRTLLGAQQLADLKADLQQAQADGITWKFILTPNPIQNLGIFKAEDRFEGYAAERTDLLRFIKDNDIDNVVFIAAGLHGTVVNNLTYQETLSGPQIATGAFEVTVGPVAIDPPAGPFGPVAVDMAESAGLITPTERAAYDALPREGKDEFVRQLIDEKLLDPLDPVVDYDHVGLDGSGIDATLLEGGYVAAHTYGWTEFEVNRGTQVLTVTTYGIDFYTVDELTANPSDIITRTPTIVSQFIVTPTNVPHLAITKMAAPVSGSILTPGNRIAYTVTLTNDGTADATGLALTDALPAGVSYVPDSISVTPGFSIATTPPPALVINGTLPVSDVLTATFMVTVTTNLTATIVNTAVVVSNQTGPVESNVVSHSVQGQEQEPGAGQYRVYLPLILKSP